MRERIRAELGDLAHPRLLVYLMGPYRAFDIEPILEAMDEDPSDLHQIPDNVDFGRLVSSDHDLAQHEVTLDLLLWVRDRLRTDPGVNAFLAIDIDIPLDEMDAATQSIEFAFASNVVVYIVPEIGDNLGVGIETGAVLEALFQDRGSDTERAPSTEHHERVIFLHEAGVRSAMIAAVQERWEARVYGYEDREDLVRQLRLFVRDIARRERQGSLPTLHNRD